MPFYFRLVLIFRFCTVFCGRLGAGMSLLRMHCRNAAEAAAPPPPVTSINARWKLCSLNRVLSVGVVELHGATTSDWLFFYHMVQNPAGFSSPPGVPAFTATHKFAIIRGMRGKKQETACSKDQLVMMLRARGVPLLGPGIPCLLPSPTFQSLLITIILKRHILPSQ